MFLQVAALETAQGFMEELLRDYSDEETAERCFSAFDGIDYQDLEEIGKVIRSEPMLAPYADEIIAKYKTWLIRRSPF
jgi:hypothetical protein